LNNLKIHHLKHTRNKYTFKLVKVGKHKHTERERERERERTRIHSTSKSKAVTKLYPERIYIYRRRRRRSAELLDFKPNGGILFHMPKQNDSVFHKFATNPFPQITNYLKKSKLLS
jgi:hypothetical protein